MSYGPRLLYRTPLAFLLGLLACNIVAIEPATAEPLLSQSILSGEQNSNANYLFQQGIKQFEVRQYQAALQSWLKALKIYQALKSDDGELKTRNNLGLTYSNLGQHNKAIEFYGQSLAIAQKLETIILKLIYSTIWV